MIHLGDITKISGYTAPIVDCIIGGSPCQDLSVAGKRAGLEGERSGLFMEQIRIVKEMRERDKRTGRTAVDVRPRYMVWENVPGAFSSGKPKGADFAAVLEEIIRVEEPEAPSVPIPEKGWPTAGCIFDEMGKWSVAWRVLDAQFWGTPSKPLPQRRRRIALVADFGGLSAPEILFVRQSMSGDIEPGEQTRKRASRTAEDSSGATGNGGVGFDAYNQALTGDKAKTLNSAATDADHIPCVMHNVPYTLKIRSGVSVDSSGKQAGKGALIQTDLSATIGVTQDQTLFQPVTFEPGILKREGGHVYEGVSGTLRANAGDNQMSVVQPVFGIDQQGGKGGANYSVDVSPPILSDSHGTPHAVAYGIGSFHSNAWKSDNPNSGVYEADTAKTLDALNYGYPACNQGGMAVVQPILLEMTSTKNTIVEDGVCPTLTARMGTGGNQVNAVLDKTVCMDAGFYSSYVEQSPTLLARTYKDPHIVAMEESTCYRQGGFADYVEGEVGTLRAASEVTSGGSESLVRTHHIVRRLTPLECERLQGFPSEKKWDVSKMTKDEYIAWNLAEGNILVDAEKGIVYGTRGPGGVPYKEPKPLKGSEVNGYKVVSIRNGATKLQCRVHRIVWISQNGIIPEGYCIDHINNDKHDNRISNLQLLTPAQNSTKAKEDGLYVEGLDNKATKLDPDLRDELCYLYQFSDFTQRELAEVYGISKSRVNQLVKEVGWTDIGEWIDSKGKKHKEADSPRYRALGNSIALPPWKFVLKRLCACYERDATMASLFDGIGGFPLIWEQLNGKGSCLWASEIEEFPMAVTKLRFGGEDGWQNEGCLPRP